MLNKVRHFLAIIIGVLLAAIGFSCVLFPNNLIAPGLGGIATIMNKVIGLNVQVGLILLLIPIIIWAFLKYERKQVYYAGFCFILFTILIGVVEKVLPAFKTDAIIAAVVAGVLLGASAGIIIREGVANGPEAIIGLYLKEKKDITIGNFFMILNFCIVSSSLIYGDITYIVYSMISIYLSSKVTDFIILGSRRNYSVNIISDNYFDITEFIHDKLNRGVTFVQCVDTNQIKKRMMLRTVVTKSELVLLKHFVAALNDNSFVFVTESIEVIGEGFSE